MSGVIDDWGSLGPEQVEYLKKWAECKYGSPRLEPLAKEARYPWLYRKRKKRKKKAK